MPLDARIKAVGFDMDGTFMHTHIDYAKLNHVIQDEFLSLGVPKSVVESTDYKFTLDFGKNWLYDHGMEDKVPGIEDRIGKRATDIEIEHADMARPYPGAVELLDRLKAMGYKVGILTRGGRRYATKILGDSGVLPRLDALVARDDYPEDQAKPNPIAMEHLAHFLGVRPEEVLYLGDGWKDYASAVDAGAQFIGVETGGWNKATWDSFVGKDVDVIPSVAELSERL